MKYLVTVALVLSLAACTTAQTGNTSNPPSAAPAPYALPHFKRPNLLVADLDRSLEIYQDILGFSPGNISESSTDSFSYPVFKIPREARMRYTYLGENQEARVFGLTEVKGVTLPSLPDRPRMSGYVIGVSDLTGKIKRLQALGLQTTESKIAGGSEFRFIEQAFVDYDGHLIVLYEILPGEAP